MATWFSLGSVWLQLLGRCNSKQHNMSLVVLGPAELLICSVESIQHAHHPVHLVEPNTTVCDRVSGHGQELCVYLPVVMVSMCLRGRHEGEVVAAVCDGGVENGHRVPEPGQREVRAHDEGT